MTIYDLYAKLEKVDVEDIAYNSLYDTAKGYTDKQRLQMYEGKNSDGTDRPPYAAMTVAIKTRKGQRVDVVTLKDTGDFYKGLFIDIRQDTFAISSLDIKTLKIVDRYGDIIFGLTGPWKQMYINENLFPRFMELMEQATGLKFAV